MNELWSSTPSDETVAASLSKFLPDKLFDFHAHLYRRQDYGGTVSALIQSSPEYVDLSIWKSAVSRQVGVDRLIGGLFFPYPHSTVNVPHANQFVCEQTEHHPNHRALILITPQTTESAIQPLIERRHIVGFKPYYCFAESPPSQARLSQYLPEWVWNYADRNGSMVMIHLVRDRALADPDNQADLVEHCRRYPNAKIILAHAGRGFHAPNTIQGIAAFRGIENVWFDTSVICEAAPLKAILHEMGPKHLLWGSDFPVSELRGRCVTLGNSFLWIDPGQLQDTSNIKPDGLILVGLEALRALKAAADDFGLNRSDIEDIFFNNATELLGINHPITNRTATLYQHAKTRIPGGTQLLSKRPEMQAPDCWPAYFSEARGCEIWDLDGRHYFDMSTNGIGACLLGFRDPDVTRAVHRRLNLGSMCTLNPPEEVELADRLCDIHPWAGQVRFARTGGEIAAVAIRIARATTNRSLIAVCGYHGWHDWYLAANLGADDSLCGHLLPGLDPCGTPIELRGTTIPFTYDGTDEFLSIIDKYGDRLAAVIMEPCRYHNPAPGFLEQIRNETQRCGAILIFDEITIGWRLCHGGAHLQLGITPDMAVFAKALGNGHPIAAVIGTDEAMEGAHRSFISSTYWTESIGPVAALAALEKMKRCHAPVHIKQIGDRVKQIWESCAATHSLPVQVDCGHSCLAHFQFNAPNANELRTLFTQLMLDQGYLSGTSIYATCAHTDEIVDQYAEAVDRVFRQLAQCLAEDSVHVHLKGPAAHTGFRRLV